MANLKTGDKIYFPSIGSLVNEGFDEAIEGPYIKVKSKTPGVEYIMATQVFLTRDELLKSKAYKTAWAQQNERRRYNESFGRIASISLF